MTPLEPETYYHLFNRANGNERIFLNDDNYNFFIRRYLHYIDPIAETYCYCLLPNHFHFLIRIKSEKKLMLLEQFDTPQNISKELSLQFGHFFNSYCKAFNKQNNRKGSLFMKTFKRKPVNDEIYLKKLVHYIHLNPVEAKLCRQPENWPHSSYKFLISEKETILKRDQVINWFGDKANFINIHRGSFEEINNPGRF